MHEVWAPKAQQLEIEVGGRRHAMSRQQHGWWRLDDRDTGWQADYSYRIDNGQPVPDPRTPWQPAGVHAASRSVDHAAYRWSDEGFQACPLSEAVIYELHIGTFSTPGTFAGAIEKLDHLVDLGVTHVEVMPVAQWDGPRGWGYDGVDLFAPHQAYGGPEGLKQLVAACRQRGLAVLLDVVYNHLGPSGNYLPQFGPYFTERHHTVWGWAVNYDAPGSEEVRRFIIDNARMWLRDYHFDGLRLDAVQTIIDDSPRHILEDLAAAVHELAAQSGRRLVVIAETDQNDPRIVRSPDEGGFGLDAHWSDDLHHAVHVVLTGERAGYYTDFESIDDLCALLRSPYLKPGEFSKFRGRPHGQPPVGLPGDRFVVCLQNHDQVGNRARGDRLCHLAGMGRSKIAAALLLTSPYVPMLFQGEEWAASSPFQYFTSFPDEKLGRSVREGRRREFAQFGWKPEEIPDPQAESTFERSKLRWDELSNDPHRDMIDWYRQLIALRKRSAHLRDGRLDRVDAQCDSQAQWIRVLRGPITILANLSRQGVRIPLAGERSANLLLRSSPDVEISTAEAILPAETVAILGPDPA